MRTTVDVCRLHGCDGRTEVETGDHARAAEQDAGGKETQEGNEMIIGFILGLSLVVVTAVGAGYYAFGSDRRGLFDLDAYRRNEQQTEAKEDE